MAEQLAQLQMWKSLAPVMASQSTLSGIANARAAMEALLRKAAEQQAALGLVDSESLNAARGSAISQFGEAVARLRQQQPMLLAQMLQGAQAPMAALQQLAAMRQELQQQANDQYNAQLQALGQAFGYVLPEILKQFPQRRRQQAVSSSYQWDANTSLRLSGGSFSPVSLEDRMRSMLRW
jgi:Tfp pilus assembly protein PilN